MLKNLISTADSAKQPAYINYMALNSVMQNVKGKQYNFAGIKQAYDTDTVLKSLIKNFDQDGITMRTDQTKPVPTATKNKKTPVDRMAQQALAKRSK